MISLRQYILAISAAAILCGLVTAMMPKGRMHGILKMVCGVFLAILVLEPLTRIDMNRIFSSIANQLRPNGETATAFGEEISRDSMSEYIKREAQAYILDKAYALGIEAEVEVSVAKEDLPVPVGAVIRGNIPEPVKRNLEIEIQENLGIAKENLQWIGQR